MEDLSYMNSTGETFTHINASKLFPNVQSLCVDGKRIMGRYICFRNKKL